jgi:hypothetical protein
MSKRKLLDRPYCSGTLTEAGFFGLIRSALRRLSIRWKPRTEYLNSVRRPKANGGRSKFEYPCELCKKWFIRAAIEVDHRIPCGSLRSYEDIGPFVQRLLCEKDGFRILCKPCHLAHTIAEKKLCKT